MCILNVLITKRKKKCSYGGEITKLSKLIVVIILQPSCVYIYLSQIITLYTLSLSNVMCQLYFNTAGGKKKRRFSGLTTELLNQNSLDPRNLCFQKLSGDSVHVNYCLSPLQAPLRFPRQGTGDRQGTGKAEVGGGVNLAPQCFSLRLERE